MKNIIVSNPAVQYFSAGKNELKKNGLFFLFCLIMFAGILYGTLSGKAAGTELLNRLDFVFQTNFELRCSQGIWSAFIASFASSMLFFGVIFLLGLSLWGGFFAVLIPLFKGYGYGLSVGYLYGTYGLKGIFYNLLVILPGTFLASVVTAAASLIAFKNSLHFVLGTFRSQMMPDLKYTLRGYCRSMFGMLLLSMASSLIDMLCSLCFSWIFHF